jgi:hypothetical protein
MASMTQIAGYAYTAGLRSPTKLAMAVAIAEAESGGNPNVHNTKGLDDSYGLWQINLHPGAHTTGELGISSPAALFDPVTNAKAMVKISHSGANWGPWSTYPLKAAAFYPAAQAAVAVFLADPSKAAPYVADAAGTVSDATGVGALAQGVTEAVQAPLKVLNWLTQPGTWVRISLMVLGGAMVIGGLYIFAKPEVQAVTKTVGKAAQVAGTAAKVAAV